MCGINGLIYNGKKEGILTKIDLMNNSLLHRGPDNGGVWNNEKLAFGHRRLSIIDLSASGNQPMVSNDGSLILIINGEIYNYKILKKELENKGYKFKSSSDSEVVLYSYKEWGTEAFRRFNGMFALAIYDKTKNKVLLARDHAGIKPLYYSSSKDEIIFSSEIKAIKAFKPNWPSNPDWPAYFLSFGFIPFPYTTLKDVLMLQKGHYLCIDVNTLSQNSYCFYKTEYSSKISDEKEAISLVRETVLNAVDRHMISDAPIGIFLSGGIDSSLLALVADKLGHQNLNTLSITFNEATFNEQPFQDIVLKRMRPHKHKSYLVDENLFRKNLESIFSAMDQPSWDGVNSYFISQCAHDYGLKAVLSGLGGDELFGGYPSFNRINLLNIFRLFPQRIFSLGKYFGNETLLRFSFLESHSNYREYLFLRGGFISSHVAKITGDTEQHIESILESMNISNYPAARDKNLASFIETNIYMENQLLKDSDYMSMWYSLEVRVPFLDKELLDAVNSINPITKFSSLQPKFLLTKAFEDILPREIVFRKKQGFTFPFSVWLRNNMKDYLTLLPQSKITAIVVRKFMENKIHWSKLWSLLVYSHFLKN